MPSPSYPLPSHTSRKRRKRRAPHGQEGAHPGLGSFKPWGRTNPSPKTLSVPASTLQFLASPPNCEGPWRLEDEAVSAWKIKSARATLRTRLGNQFNFSLGCTCGFSAGPIKPPPLSLSLSLEESRNGRGTRMHDTRRRRLDR